MGVNGCIFGYHAGVFRTDSLEITPEILGLVAQLDEFKGTWRATKLLAPDRLAGLRRVATIESIASSTRIEGSKLSDREVEQLLSNLQIRSFTTRDEQEVAGYAELMELVFEASADLTFNESNIQQLHSILLRHSSKDQRHRGRSFDTPRLMAELMEWVRLERESGRLHPLLIIAVFVVVFLEIHPFQDGNGRLSRVLTTLLLLQAGYTYVPYSSLESVIERDKQGYYLSLRQTQATIRSERPDWQPWLVYFLRALAEQVRLLQTKLEREIAMLAPLPELSVRIIEVAREHGRVTMAQVVRLTGASRNTLKLHFRGLVERGWLHRRGQGRGVWYELRA